MKTAISIDEGLFRKAEKLSTKLQISRSQLFAQALEYLIDRSETLEIIQKLNAVYGLNDPDVKVATKGGKRKMRGSSPGNGLKKSSGDSKSLSSHGCSEE